MNTQQNQDPTPLVARIMAELRANPPAQQMLFEAMLADEFMGVPACLYGIRKDVAAMKPFGWSEGGKTFFADGEVQDRLHRHVGGLVRGGLDVRRTRIVQAPSEGATREFLDAVESALEDGRITEGQELRLDAAQFIVRALRRADGVPVWIAIEGAATVRLRHVLRARASADALRAVFGEEALAAVGGYSIDAASAEQADAAGVVFLNVPKPPRKTGADLAEALE